MNNERTHALVVIGGDCPDPRSLAFIEGHPTVICADSGLDHALELGLVPEIFLGDMDSVSAHSLQQANNASWTIISYDPFKDQTDTELALNYAVVNGFRKITMLWGSGDRIDHVLGVLAALSHHSLRSLDKIVAWIGTNRVEILHAPRTYRDDVTVGTTISLMPLGASVAGVTTQGLQWNLNEAVLSSQTSRGVSNIAQENSVHVQLDEGVLAVVYPGFLNNSSQKGL